MVFSRHLVFTGGLGTGKTTLTRFVERLYAAINVLPSHKFIEVSAADFIARYVRQTALNVLRVMLEARSGVLFIDEVYALMTSGE
jgi:replication-associated recombination protein RarA